MSKFIARALGRGGASAGGGAGAREVDPERLVRRRAWIVAGAILAIYAALSARLYEHQVAHADHWRGLAVQQQRPIREVMAYRGDIVDSRGVVLARSVRVKSAFAEPRFMGAKRGKEPATAADLAAAAHAIAQALGYDEGRERLLLSRFTNAEGKPLGFCWIERRMADERAERLRAARVPGVSFKDEYRREYPQGSLCSHIVGLVALDDQGDLKGLSGVEQAFDRELTGVNGLREVVRDAAGGSLLDEGALEVPPEDGATIVLTIDTEIQRIVEREVAKAGAEWSPEGILVTVLRPKDGKILAMASWPTYDPGTLKGLSPEALRFRPLLDTYEPGSIVKPLIVATGLETGAFGPTKTFDTTSPRHVGPRVVKDSHPKPGLHTLREILAYSLNCGMVQVGDLIGPRGLRAMLERCGFGRPTGIGVIEQHGTIPPLSRWLSRWGFHSTVSVSQGYEMAVTQLQIASAFASLGNGGVRMQPLLLERIEDAHGTVVKQSEPQVAAKICSPEVLKGTVLPALEDAVQIGTARRAALPEWRLGGKTGTAKKQVGRGYSSTRNRSSFFCLAPIDDPQLFVGVTVDDPKSKGGDPSGGIVSAPVVKGILQDVLPYLRVPHSPPRPDGEKPKDVAGE
ncbi:MAG TPA: penicillin-binding protein 2 [Planctomycetota bacterium]|nr:penicillin-binding protein 2 [Planctomycetota bacterium]